MIHRGQTVPPFEKAAFELKVGELSNVVETRFGYHILKVTKHDEAKQLSYDEAKENILNQLKQQRTKDLTDQYIESLKAKATIVYPENSG